MGWDYAIAWLTVLPFELIAAGITIEFWRPDLNVAIWVTVFLVILSLIQIFGVRGYGEGKKKETILCEKSRVNQVANRIMQSSSFLA